MQRESSQSTSFPFVPSTISVSCRFSRSYEAASLDEFQRVSTFDVIHLSSSSYNGFDGTSSLARVEVFGIYIRAAAFVSARREKENALSF